MNAETVISEIEKLLGPVKGTELEKLCGELGADRKVSALQESPSPYGEELAFMSPAKAWSISKGMFTRNDELFRKLAQ